MACLEPKFIPHHLAKLEAIAMDSSKLKQLYLNRLKQALLQHIKEGLAAEESTNQLLEAGYEVDEIISASAELCEQISQKQD